MNKRNPGLTRVIVIVVVVAVAAISWIVLTKRNNVAIVNGERLSRRDFIGRLEENSGSQILNQMIDEKLIQQAAKEAKVSVKPEEVDEEVQKLRKEIGPSFDSMLAQYGMTEADLRTNLDMNLLVFKLSTKDVTVTDEEMQKYFDEHKSDYDEPEQVKASHILVETESEAKEIQKRLSAGEEFASIATEKSLDPGSAAEGGDLGFFPRGRMTAEFEKVAFSMAPGQTSNPVKSEFGYHIIRVTDRKAAHEATFEEVKDDVERQIKGKQAKSPQQVSQELRMTGKITVTDSKYKDLGNTTPFGVK
ncbi:MAG: peptidylprolyl isomerase [Clostridia bacterium]|nr:peptidylprolyl isomerase [Clostridia bacterium]